MTTNYYWASGPGQNDDPDSPEIHIGKRANGGAYCFDCGVTLQINGTQFLHMDWVDSPLADRFSSEYGPRRDGSDPRRTRQHKACPCCGTPKEQCGIVFTFRWTKMAHKWELEQMVDRPSKVVVDETGKAYSAAEFLEAIKTPVEYQVYCYFD